ncbi:MAG: tetratricopeptide repeat protein [Proteobacteria bacterium]|nr:tetratricopeptide repeat protein [Pseudomonadota bacterium]
MKSIRIRANIPVIVDEQKNRMPLKDSMNKPLIHRLKINGLIVLFIASALAFVYHQTLHFDFINFDDPVYVTANPAVQDGLTYESLAWAFGIHSDICMYYQPVAWISHMADCQWFGLDPGKHHRTSVLIHGFNAILLFLILNAMTGATWRSAFAAAIFVLHPVNVDAVTWISERKTILSACFWLLGMGAYLYYIRKPSRVRYLPVILLFSLGLLTKPVMVTFPCALVLLDIWPLERIRTHSLISLIKEKIPLFIITALWCVTPLLSETLLSNETTPDMVSYGLRISNALVSYSKYVFNFYMPHDLAILYPYPTHVPLVHSMAALIFLLSITLWACFKYTRKPFLLIGWLWFAGTLFPTSGLILGTLWPEMADRWAYIPYMGLCMLTAWIFPEWSGKNMRFRLIPTGLALCFLLWLGYTAKTQVSYWKDSIRVFEKALTVIGYHALPHQNIATEFMNKKNYDLAENHLKIILENEPDHVDANYNMGLCLAETGRENEALNYFNHVLTRNPGFTKAYLMKAKILDKTSGKKTVKELYETALIYADKKDDILYNYALFLSHEKRREEAEQRFLELLSHDPRHGQGHGAYADLLMDRNDYKKALYYAGKTVALEPDSPQALNRLGICLVRLGDYTEGIRQFNKAIELNETYHEARLNLEVATMDQRLFEKSLDLIKGALPFTQNQHLPDNPEEILSHLDKILQSETITPGIIKAYQHLSTLFRLQGNYAQALSILEKIRPMDPRYETSIQYNMACIHALMNDPVTSVAHLKKAMDADVNLIDYVKKDHDFDRIRESKAFQQLTKTPNKIGDRPIIPLQ